MDLEGSESTSSASESSLEMQTKRPIPNHTKKRKKKTTYEARKDEIHALHVEIQELKAQLAHHERHAPLEKVTLAKAERMNRILVQKVDQNGMAVAGVQATLSAYNFASIQSTGLVPLHDYIHLPLDHDARRAVLASLYESKIHKTAQFMAERTRGLDFRVMHQQVEEFELPDGHMGLLGMNILPINSGHNLRQVFEALVCVAMNQEISLSEKLGVLTIRESEDTEDFKYCHTRLLSSIPGGLEIESNVAMFGTYVGATDQAPPYALATLDFVEQDDLYPYRPEICVRKEATVGVLLREIPGVMGGSPTIAVARWYYIRMLPPQFPVSENVKELVYTNMVHWSGSIPKMIKEGLTTMTPAHAFSSVL